jgi:hypothetical protein
MDQLIEELNSLKINCNKSESNSDRNETTIKAIESFAKTVLSETWTHEIHITEDSFRSQSSEEVLITIIYLLDGIKQLCHEFNNKTTVDNNYDYNCVKTLLGIDFAECLLWRKGALLYAYCNCKLNNEELVQQNDDLFDEDMKHKLLSYLIEGIQWFRLLLRQRQPIDDLLIDDKIDITTTQSLIEKNIFSDNHLLSMMYLSEMCFWYQKYSNEWKLYLYTDFDLKQCAKCYLNIYINAVENYFKNIGWSCDRAKHLLTLI